MAAGIVEFVFSCDLACICLPLGGTIISSLHVFAADPHFMFCKKLNYRVFSLNVSNYWDRSTIRLNFQRAVLHHIPAKQLKVKVFILYTATRCASSPPYAPNTGISKDEAASDGAGWRPFTASSKTFWFSPSTCKRAERNVAALTFGKGFCWGWKHRVLKDIVFLTFG